MLPAATNSIRRLWIFRWVSNNVRPSHVVYTRTRAPNLASMWIHLATLMGFYSYSSPSLLESSSTMYSVLSVDVCRLSTMESECEWKGATLFSCGYIPLTILSIKDVPNSGGTARRVTIPNQAFTRTYQNCTWRSVSLSKLTDCFLSAVKPGYIIARMRSVHVGGILDLRLRLGFAPF